VTLITVGIQYLYFVGFWTSRWRSTPGMMGLSMRVVDAASGGTLSIVEATKRWIALGFPLALLGLICALQGRAGVLQFGLLIFLFFTTVTSARRQGLHDRWANSLVIRSARSGNGATAWKSKRDRPMSAGMMPAGVVSISHATMREPTPEMT
jgi:uncharacterized RDD family membrane protein YckC